ncbi:unnamed protein product [Spirodela intermedia]|uniref:Uncharacterized protein n=1 Tax=Spirodela intermedia TaxID=51605 RepID=A0A7I8IBC4_SPIIN|nr:unnamed protein product [Spirodela intermedia]CAA6655057.1 unnamed protein product [Spirodela intermedia]
MTNAEFRLPSEFLADDFFLEKKNGGGGGEVKGGGGCRFPTEFPYEWEYGSNLSSPVESVTGTESSDEEDYMAGLTRQMAHYFLQDEEKGPTMLSPAATRRYSTTNRTSCWSVTPPVGSPQSTLCAFGGMNGSSRESSNGPSLVSSPPSSPLEQYKDDAWDLLYAAAGQVMRMRLNDECDQQHTGRGLLGQPVRKPSPPLPVCHPKNVATGYSNAPLNQNQLRAQQFQQLKQEQFMKQQGAAVWNRQSRPKGAGPRGGIPSSRPARQQGLSPAAWPPIQQQPRSGMRASCGTGVFLPRRVDSPADFRKKPACSTVLLPARVVQALNLDLEELSAQPRFSADLFSTTAPSLPGQRDVAAEAELPPQPAPANPHHHPSSPLPEIRLPSEWTY